MSITSETNVAALVKVLIWPIVLLMFLVIFNGPVERLIDRTVKAKWGSFEVQAAVSSVPTSIAAVGCEPLVLWVDDNPNNNRYEQKALSEVAAIETAASTDEALRRIKEQQYTLVITDLKRADDPQAGFTLLAALSQAESRPPVIIYSGSSAADLRAEAKQKGAVLQTNDPVELYIASVTSMLKSIRKQRCMPTNA